MVKREIMIEPSRRKTFSAPMWIRECKDLTLNEKFLLEEVHSFATTKKGFFASNAWLASKMGLSEKTVSNIVSALHRRGYLWRKIDQSAEYTRYLGLVSEFENPVADDRGAVHSKMDSPIHAKMDRLSTPECTAVHSTMDASITDVRDTKGEGTAQPPPISFKPGSKEDQSVQAWRHVQEVLGLQPCFPVAFLDFFGKCVLGLWNKFVVSEQIVKLWHDKLWVHFSEDQIVEGLFEYKTKDSAWTPKFPKVLAACRKVRIAQCEKEESVSRQEPVENTGGWEEFIGGYEAMTIDEVRDAYDKETNSFRRHLLQRYRPDVFKSTEAKA